MYIVRLTSKTKPKIQDIPFDSLEKAQALFEKTRHAWPKNSVKLEIIETTDAVFDIDSKSQNFDESCVLQRAFPEVSPCNKDTEVKAV